MNNVSIIVLNYNDYKETQKCIDKLIEFGVEERIVIVDNKSTNESFEILKKIYYNNKDIDVIRTEKNGGYSYGNNYGMKFSIKKYPNVQYFCIMNPDVLIMNKNIFDNLVSKIEKNDTISAISPVMLPNGKYNSKSICWDIPTEKTIYYNHIMFLKNQERKQVIKVDENYLAKVEVIPGSFFVIKRKDIEEIGWLDENSFLYNEENILANKLRLANKSVALSMDDYYCHNHKKSDEKIGLKKKLKINKIGYNSRKYLCEKFHSKKALKKLEIVNILNIMYIYVSTFIKRLDWRKK